jgi:hypothetical protein
MKPKQRFGVIFFGGELRHLEFELGQKPDGPVNAIAVSLSGEVFAGGQFTSYNGRAFYNNLVKLSPVGTVDGTFNFTAGLLNQEVVWVGSVLDNATVLRLDHKVSNHYFKS